MNTEKTLLQWRYIAFKRAAKGLPALDLTRLPDDDKRRVYYLVGQIEGEWSRGGAK
jgi:hypothetical protein